MPRRAEGLRRLGLTPTEQLAREFDRIFAEAPRAAAEREVPLLALRVGPDPYAVKVTELSGIVVDKRLVPLPSPRRELLGVIGHRAAVVPVYSLGALLGYPLSEVAPRWFMFAAGPDTVALAVDALDAHLKVATSAISAATGSRQPFLHEVVSDGDLRRPVIRIADLISTLKAKEP
ncbi:MAG: chemotaxis protein CheW [Myxococcaceae bacterium]|nr:chemotaxis protein CheW [Myxococcaceae bacterium]